MADDVNVNTGDNKSKVAYEIARDIFFASGRDLNMDTKDEFFDLVQEASRALTTKRSRPLKEKTD